MLRDQSKIPVGYLWVKKDQNEKEYFAGTIFFGVFGEIPIVVFKDDNKQKENSPDYLIRVATSPNKDKN